MSDVLMQVPDGYRFAWRLGYAKVKVLAVGVTTAVNVAFDIPETMFDTVIDWETYVVELELELELELEYCCCCCCCCWINKACCCC